MKKRLFVSDTYLALDGLRDVVRGILKRVGDLADDTLIRLVDVGGRHFG